MLRGERMRSLRWVTLVTFVGAVCASVTGWFFHRGEVARAAPLGQAANHVVISEFLPRPGTDFNGDGKANVGDEFIEIINAGTQAVNLQGWKLDDGVGGSSPYTISALTLQPGEIAYFYGADTKISLSDGGDTVRLLRPGNVTADIYVYSTVANRDLSWCRIPDKSGAWRSDCRPTPGQPNAAGAAATPTTAPAPPPVPPAVGGEA